MMTEDVAERGVEMDAGDDAADPATPPQKPFPFNRPAFRKREPAENHDSSHFILNMVKAGRNFMNPYRFRFRAFRAKVPVHVEIKNFAVKTVDTAAELEEILRLRYKVFYKEFLEKRRLIAMDIDQFDLICDHLMIIDKKSQSCVGTYRLNCSQFNSRFYSETEFSMDPIMALPGVKLELGRACVHKDFRKGIILTLLWRGLSEYIKATKTKYMFGCSSVKTMEPLEIATLTNYLMENHPSDPACRVAPHEAHQVKALSLYKDLARNLRPEVVQESVKNLLPTLLMSYLKSGAVICGEPALDKDFKCVDFFTLIDMSKTADSTAKKFL